MSERLLMAMCAARSAGRVLVDKSSAAREIHSKGKHDIVTDADYAAERVIRNLVHDAFPDDRFLSEESDVRERKALWAEAEASDSVTLWVVDPLDGTTNYAHRQPLYSVSIGVYARQAAQLGVVYDPVRKELFAAERGRGAHLNGRPICVSATEKWDDAVVGMDWPRDPALRQDAAAKLAVIMRRVASLRGLGSAALALCYVAAGRLDGYFHLALSPWDVAAGGLIIQEAGGRVTTAAGEPWSIHSPTCVATNGPLQRAMLRHLRAR